MSRRLEASTWRLITIIDRLYSFFLLGSKLDCSYSKSLYLEIEAFFEFLSLASRNTTALLAKIGAGSF